jgi:miniconductance mechanosensitive channel
MSVEIIQAWIYENPNLALAGAVVLSYFLYLITRFIFSRVIQAFTARTENIYDDMIVEHIRPYRIAWLVPLLFLFVFSGYTLGQESAFGNVVLFLIIWVVVYSLALLLNGLNEVYETRPNYSGVSIQGYLDIVKILFAIVGIILSISLFTGESPVGLLSGLGALTAVLLLVFRDTILSLVASVQIASNDLIKEGDWIEVPGYGADGDVLDMTLHAIKVQNFDKTITVIPTYKMVEVAYKNWRGMSESGGRRIKRSIFLDIGSVKFCNQAMLSNLQKIDLIKEYLSAKLEEIDQYNIGKAQSDSPLDGAQITNSEIFRAYIAAYLRGRDDIHQEKLTFLIRSLAPERHGLPIELYIFTKTTDWVAYENIQAEIFEHLLAIAPVFELRVFQDPTGLDFSTLVK